MGRISSINKRELANLIFLILFGITFGFVEAAVVYYLRNIINFHTNYGISSYKTLLNLDFITFVTSTHTIIASHTIDVIEVLRESATIIMLIAIAFIAGSNYKQRIGAFLVGFACWDIMYYVFLKILTNWPASFTTKDVFFLIPVTWIGPVITPLIISTVMLIVGIKIYLQPTSKKIIASA